MRYINLRFTYLLLLTYLLSNTADQLNRTILVTCISTSFWCKFLVQVSFACAKGISLLIGSTSVSQLHSNNTKAVIIESLVRRNSEQALSLLLLFRLQADNNNGRHINTRPKRRQWDLIREFSIHPPKGVNTSNFRTTPLASSPNNPSLMAHRVCWTGGPVAQQRSVSIRKWQKRQ